MKDKSADQTHYQPIMLERGTLDPVISPKAAKRIVQHIDTSTRKSTSIRREYWYTMVLRFLTFLSGTAYGVFAIYILSQPELSLTLRLFIVVVFAALSLATIIHTPNHHNSTSHYDGHRNGD